MPEPGTFLVFALTALALVLMPGPNVIYIVTRGVDQGRRAGLASALGVETATLVHVAAAAAGVSALLASSAAAFEVVKYAGAAYLAYLGVRTLLSGDGLGSGDSPPPARLGRVYTEGFVVNLLNPKVALFFLAFLPQFVDREGGSAAPQILALGAVLFAIGLVSALLQGRTLDLLLLGEENAAALGVDIDETSIVNARQNADTNQIGEELILGVGSVPEILDGKFPFRTAPLVVANILAPVIVRLFDAGLAQLMETGGALILSGILQEQAQSVIDAAQAKGLGVREQRQIGDWVALTVS